MGWKVALIKHLRDRRVTVHGLDIGIPADMTEFSSLSALLYNGEGGSLGTSKRGCKPSRLGLIREGLLKMRIAGFMPHPAPVRPW